MTASASAAPPEEEAPALSSPADPDSEPHFSIPAPADFPIIAKLQTAAFSEKLACEGLEESEFQCREAYGTYFRQHPDKLQHCRILKLRSPLSTTGFIVVAACQLQAHDDPGDLTFPSGMRHKLQPGEVYIEWIACHPDHLGKGLGSRLLQWAEEYAKNELQAKTLTLSVMKANVGAARLYERKGFAVVPEHDKSWWKQLVTSLFIFCCMGCQYWHLLFMEKRLDE